jgi:hypothetical protein
MNVELDLGLVILHARAKDGHWKFEFQLMFVEPLRTWGVTMNTPMLKATSLNDEVHE